MSQIDIWRSTLLCTAGGGLTTYCSTTVGSTSASSPSSSSSGDSEYPPSSQGPEDDDDAFMGGNANAASDSLCAPYRKRAYVFATRRRRAKPLKERFFQSVTRGLIQSEERLALEISDCCVCKKKCSIAFVEEPGLLSELLRCRNEFHSLRKHSDRRMYLRSLLTLTVTGRYTLLGIRCCVNFIRGAMLISLNLFYGVIVRLSMSHPISLHRTFGHSRGISAEESICAWLIDLARLHDPQPDRPYTILAFKRKHQVYAEYCEATKNGEVPKVSLSYFLRIWFTRLGSQIVIRKCLRFALCDTCSNIQRKREMTSDRESLLRIARLEKDHIKVVKGERSAYALRVRDAHARGEDILSIAMDGADQGAYGLPYFCQPSKQSSTIFKIRQYLVGVCVHSVGVYLFRHMETFPRGSNVTIEVLHRVFEKEATRRGGVLPATLYLQLDNCWRENKNRYVFAYLSDLVTKGVFKDVFVSFLIKGHTHFDPDQVFSRISVKLDTNNAFCPSSFKDNLKSAYTPQPLVEDIDCTANVSGMLEEGKYINKLPQDVSISRPHVFRMRLLPKEVRGENNLVGIVTKGLWGTSEEDDPWTTNPFVLVNRPLDYSEVPPLMLRGPSADVLKQIERGLSIFEDIEPDEEDAFMELQDCVLQLREASSGQAVPFGWRLTHKFEPSYVDQDGADDIVGAEYGKSQEPYEMLFDGDVPDEAVDNADDCGEERDGDGYDDSFLAEDRKARVGCEPIVLGRRVPDLATNAVRSDSTSLNQVQVGDFVAVRVTSADKLPFYIGRVRAVFQYRRGSVPERVKQDVEDDPALKFLEVHWWQPPGDKFGLGYKNNRLYQATRINREGFCVDHVDVISELSILLCFEDLISKKYKGATLVNGKLGLKVVKQAEHLAKLTAKRSGGVVEGDNKNLLVTPPSKKRKRVDGGVDESAEDFRLKMARLRQGVLDYVRLNFRVTRDSPWRRGTLKMYEEENPDGVGGPDVCKYFLQLDDELDPRLVEETDLDVGAGLFDLGAATPRK